MAEETLTLHLIGKNEVSGALKSASVDLSNFRGQVMSTMGDIKGLLAGFGVALSFGAAIKEGLSFNQVIEDTNIGISAVIGTLYRWRDATGEFVTGQEKFNLASVQATEIQEKLKLAALATTATYQDMVQGFQMGIGPMTHAGIKMQDTVEVTQRLTQAMGSLGVPMHQLGIEMRQFFEGDVARSRLLQGLGITSSQIKTLTASGGLLDELRKKTDSIKVAGDAAALSMTGLSSNLHDAMSQLLGKGTEGLFVSIKRQIAELTGSLVRVDTKGFTFSPELLERIKAISGYIAELTDRAAPLVTAFIKFGLASGEVVARLMALGGPILDYLTKILNFVTPLIDRFGDWAVAAWGVYKALAAISTIQAIGGFSGKIAGMGAPAWTGVTPAASGAGPGGIPLLGQALGGVSAAGLAGAAMSPIGLAATAAGLLLCLPLVSQLSEETGKLDKAEKDLQDTMEKSHEAYQRLGLDLTWADEALLNTLKLEEKRAVIEIMRQSRKPIASSGSGFDAGYFSPKSVKQAMDERTTDLESVPVADDMKIVNALILERITLLARVAAMPLSGISKKRAEEEAKYADEEAKLQVRYAEAGQKKKERGAIDALIQAKKKEHNAAMAGFNREEFDDAQKHNLAILKLDSDRLTSGIEGMGKDIILAQTRLAYEMAASEERLRIAERDRDTYAAVKREEYFKLQYEQQHAMDELAKIARKGNEDFESAMSGGMVELLRNEGDDLQAGMEEIRQRLKEQLAKLAREAEGLRAALKPANPLDTDAKGITATDAANAPIIAMIDKVEQREDMAVKVSGSNAKKMEKDFVLAHMGMQGALDALWADVAKQVNSGAITVRDGLTRMGDAYIKWGETTEAGITGAMLKIKGSVVSNAEGIATALQGIWSSMGSTFQAAFADVLSGKFDDLKNVFKNFTDSLINIWSKYLSDMLMKWLASQISMEDGQFNPAPAGGGRGGGGGALGSLFSGGSGGGSGGLFGGQSFGGSGGTVGAGLSGNGYGLGGPDGTGETGGNADWFTGGGGSSGTSTSAVGGGYAAAGAGLAIGASAFGGATGGAQAFGQGLSPYLSAAAMAVSMAGAVAAGVFGAAAASSVIPVVGWIVAAVLVIVGVVLNLLAKDTEQAYQVTAKSLKLSMKNLGDLSRTNTEGGAALVAQSAGGQALIDTKDKLTDTLTHAFMLGPDKALGMTLAKAVNDAISKYLLNIDFTVHAGSDEDIKKDFEFLFGQIIPKEIMATLFGMKLGGGMAQKFGGMDVAGISGAKYFDAKLGVDESAPLVQFLTGIGVTIGKVRELAAQSQTTDPKVFLDRLKLYITVLTTADAIVKDLQRTFGEVTAAILGERGKSPGEAFQKMANDIATAADQLQFYSGDEALKQFDDVNKMAASYRDQEVQALTNLIDLAKSFRESVENLLRRVTESSKTEAQRAADAWRLVGAAIEPGRVTGVRVSGGLDDPSNPMKAGPVIREGAGAILGAKTVDDLKAAASAALEAISYLFDQLLRQLERGKELMKTASDLRDLFAMSTADQVDAANKNPFRVMNETQADIQAKLAMAWQQSGQEQLDTLADINTEAQDMYNLQLQMLQQIHDNIIQMQQDFANDKKAWEFAGLHNQKDIDKAKAKLAQSTDPTERAGLEAWIAKTDPHEQIDWIKRQIDVNKAALANATTPEEVQRLTKEIERLTNQYVGMFDTTGFGPSGMDADPNRAGAIDWAKRVLGTTQEEATAKYKLWEKEIEDHNKEMLTKMDAAKQLLIDNQWHASKAIERLTADLNTLNSQVITKLREFGDQIVATSETVWQAIDDASKHFKEAIDDPLVGMAGAARNGKRAIDAFSDALDEATNRMGGSTGGGGGEEEPPDTGGGNSVRTRQVGTFSMLRRNGPALTSRMTGA